MSPLVRRPSLPVPGTVPASMPLSAASFRTDGASGTSAGATLAAADAIGTAGGETACGAGCSGAAGLDAAFAPSWMWPSSAPTATVSPSLALISDNTPAAGAGTSIVTLSVSNSTTGSSTATASPGCLNQRPMVASVTDSPSAGTRMSAMGSFLQTAAARRRTTDRTTRAVCPDLRPPSSVSLQRLVEQALELGEMARHEAGRRCRRGRPAGIARPLVLGADLIEHPLDERIDEEPCAHVARLFLAPHDLRLLEAGELVYQRLGRERMELLDPHQVDIVDPALFALLVQVEIDLPRAQHHAADVGIGNELDLLVRQQLRVVPQQ